MRNHLSLLVRAGALLLLLLTMAGCSSFTISIPVQKPNEIPTELFPAIRHGLVQRIGHGSVCVQMLQGWYSGTPDWYIAWDTSAIKQWQFSRLSPCETYELISALKKCSVPRRYQKDFKKTIDDCEKNPPQTLRELACFFEFLKKFGITLTFPPDIHTFPPVNPVPKLLSALQGGAPTVYLVTNFQQGPVFTTRPGNTDYSGLWHVVFLTWNPGVTPRPIIDASSLPADVTQSDAGIVVNWPTMAIGPLGGPWPLVPPGGYRIGQVQDYNLYSKVIKLPAWAAFSRDPVHRTIVQVETLITDVSDPVLAEIIQANFAPGLDNVPSPDTQKIWIFDWTQMPAQPPAQLPVMQNIPTPVLNAASSYEYNTNRDFSPVMQIELLRRTTLPPAVYNNPELIESLLPPTGTGLEVIEDSYRLNALIVRYSKWTNGMPIPQEIEFTFTPPHW